MLSRTSTRLATPNPKDWDHYKSKRQVSRPSTHGHSRVGAIIRGDYPKGAARLFVQNEGERLKTRFFMWVSFHDILERKEVNYKSRLEIAAFPPPFHDLIENKWVDA